MKKSLLMIILVLSSLFFTVCSGQSDGPYDPDSDVTTAAQALVGNGYTTMFNGYVLENGNTWSAPFAGILKFDLPDPWIEANGTIKATGGSESIPGSGLVEVNILYHTMSEEDYNTMITGISLYSYYAQADASALEKYNALANIYVSNFAQLCSIYAVSDNATEQEFREKIKNIYVKYGGANEAAAEKSVSSYTIIPAGTAADFTFYIVQTENDYGNAFSGNRNGDYREEFETLHKNISEIIPNITFARPLGLTEINLDTNSIQFATTDLRGNPITSKDLFSGHKVTMLNIWSTTCSICYTEIPELQKMQAEFSEKGGQIAGLLYDGNVPELAAEAQQFLDEYGITYTNIAANEELKTAFPTQSFPMTYFFNEKGEMIGEPVIGANLRQYRQFMELYLSESAE